MDRQIFEKKENYSAIYDLYRYTGKQINRYTVYMYKNVRYFICEMKMVI